MKAISAVTGWDITTGSENVIVANLDTGVNMNHPDLKGRFVAGYDVINSDNDPSDDHGHGTVTTGVSSAVGNNATGITGVDWKGKIMPVKVLSSTGSGTSSHVAQGLNWAADNGAHVANMSLGGTTPSNTMENSMKYAHGRGVVLVAAAGNSGDYCTDICQPEYPAAYPTVIAVGALQATVEKPNWDQRASWSMYYNELELMAPGSRIWTTTRSGGYEYPSGTSVAAPFVSGLAGLIKAVNPALSNEQIRTIMKETATDLGDPGFDIYYGYGRINVEAALTKAKGGSTVTPPPPTTDATAPSVAVSAPSAGSTVSGVIDASVTASDNVGVSKVELYIDGKVYASTTVSPYIFSVDTTKYTNASHTFSAKAYDAAGNVGTSANVSVTVSNVSSAPTDTTLPTITITSPKDGSNVSRKVNISVSATDNVGVQRVEIYTNGKLLTTLYTSPYNTSWNVNGKNVPKGENIITAYAYDAAGNVSTASVRVLK
jgi:thermitase